MDTIKVIKENLKAVVEGDHGEWLNENVKEADLGTRVFISDKFTNTLCLYSDGVFYKTNSDELSKELKIKYSDINSIDSSLTIEKYSEASKTGNYSELTSMVLRCSSGSYELMVPLVIYSGVLISLNECSKSEQWWTNTFIFKGAMRIAPLLV